MQTLENFDVEMFQNQRVSEEALHVVTVCCNKVGLLNIHFQNPRIGKVGWKTDDKMLIKYHSITEEKKLSQNFGLL